MLDRLKAWHPFQSPDTQRLAVLFAIVYFAQGMWGLPDQTITITFKDRGFEPGPVAAFFAFATVPWMIKPVYGLLSDFVPLFGRRRKSYLLLTSSTACVMGLLAGLSAEHTYWRLAILYAGMGLGLAFTDVLTDALMVENGKPRGLTGAFQAVQWAAITVAAILVGVLGGHLAEHRDLHAAFFIAAGFPLATLVMTVLFVRDPRVRVEGEAFRQTWAAIRAGLGERSVWLVAGFVFLFNFSPSFGPAFLYYQTDILRFSQTFIGYLSSLYSAAAVVGAFIYAPLSRRMPLRRVINLAIGLSVAGTLAYLLYRGHWSAIAIEVIFGCAGMVTQLAFLDLAAKACPKGVEATFFALLMSVFNAGNQASRYVGAELYTHLGGHARGYHRLVLISAAATALVWLLVPFVRIERIETKARAAADPSAAKT
jgi:MFS family permease